MKALPVICAVFGLIITTAHFHLVGADPDLWWHLAVGKEIALSGQIHVQDRYSHTTEVVPWINHSWLAEYFMGRAYLQFGERGLVVLRTALLFLVITAFFRGLIERSGSIFVAGALSVTAATSIANFVELRPQAWSVLAIVLLVLIFDSARRGSRMVLLTLPVLFAIWSNLHGGFVIGFAFAFLSLVELAWNDKSIRRLVVFTVALTVIATVSGPNGFRIYTYLLREAGASKAFNTDWIPLPASLTWRYVCIGIVPLLLALMVRTRKRLAESAFLFVAALLTLRHGRFIVFVEIFGPLCLARDLEILCENYGARRFFAILRAPALGALLAVLLGAQALRIGSRARVPSPLLADETFYPVRAVDFLEQSPGSRIGTPIQWGGYLIWRLGGKSTVSIDGRNVTLYSPEYVPKHIGGYVFGDLPRFLSGNDSDVLLLEREGPLYRAAEAASWRSVYEDSVAAVFIKQ